MDLAQLTEALKSLSPFVAILVLIGALVYRWFDYREKKDEAEAVKAEEARKQEDHNNLLEVLRLSNETASGQQTVQTLITAHNDSADLRFEQEVEIFKQILRQLISLNAASTGGISTDNAKLIVQYQWNWCRNETSRVIQNSIRNNHFRGEEDRVARSVFRAWHRAAADSLASIVRLKGVTYPFQALYTHHITLAWDRTWSWAISVYYASRKNDEDFDATLRDLDGMITTLFDQIFEIHVSLVEDVDIGVLYEESAGDQKLVTVPHDITRPENMAIQLATHRQRETPGDTTARLWTPESIREWMKKAVTDKPSKPYQKTRSSVDISPNPV